MNEHDNIENIEIPDILLELNGLKTSGRILNASNINEAKEILQSGRIVEAGISDWFKNIIKGKRFNAEEVTAVIERLKTLGVSSQATPEQAQHYQHMIDFLENLNKDTNTFVRKPFQKGMNNYWENLDELAQRAESSANQIDKNRDLDNLQQSIGQIGAGIDEGLNKGSLGLQGWFNRLSKKDIELIQQPMSGVYRIEQNGSRVPITYKDFFERGYFSAGGNTSKGDIIMDTPDAIKQSLAKLTKGVATSSAKRGWLNMISQASLSVGVAVPVVMGGGIVWGFNRGVQNAPSQEDYDKVGNSDYLAPSGTEHKKIIDLQGQSNSSSGGLGGTTNGNNFGSLGGQYLPNSTPQTMLPKPNLPNNPNDWLPTNSSDYYNLVDRKSDIDLENMRFAQNAVDNSLDSIVDLDDAVRKIITILEQGVPGEETLQMAIHYANELNKKTEPILNRYYQQLTNTKADQAKP